MTTERLNPVVEVIDGYEEDVGLLFCLKGEAGSKECDQEEEGAPKVHLSLSF